MEIRLRDLPDQEFALMHDATLRLLHDYGVLFEHEEAQRLLTKAGNEADSQGRVHLKPKFVESMLDLIPKNGFLLYGRDENKTVHAAPGQIGFRPSTGAPFIYDYDLKQRRDATMDDARLMTTVADALENMTMVNAVVNPAGAPGGLGSVRLFVNAHRYSLKPSDVTVMTKEEVNLIGRIAAVIRGGEKALREKPIVAVDVGMITPLRCAGEQVEAFLESARWGMPVEVLTSPAMGLSGPVTVSGSTLLATAETIAALCLIYQVAPGLGIISTSRVSPLNMRTSEYNYGAPELGMASALSCAQSARYHIPCDMYGFGTCAKAPGVQATMEKIFSGMLMCLGQPYMVTGGGILENALTTSPDQLVIDNEAARFIKRIRKPMEVTEDALGLTALAEGMKTSGHVMGEEHTIRYLKRGELLDAGLGQWSAPGVMEETVTDLLERAHHRRMQILATHHVPPFEPAVDREIRKLLGDD